MTENSVLVAQYKCSLNIAELGKTEADGKKCLASIYTDRLILAYEERELLFDYYDLVKLEHADYRTVMRNEENLEAEVYALGLQYENFCRDLTSAYNRCLKTYLLMDEKMTGFEAKCSVEATINGSYINSRADVLFSENGAVVLPEKGMPFRVPFSAVEKADESEYRIKLTLSLSESVIFSMLGREYDPFLKEMNRVNDMIVERSGEQLSFMKNVLDESTFYQLCTMMKDGKGVERSSFDRISGKAFVKFIEYIGSQDSSGRIGIILKISDSSEMLFGIKRGLMGSLTGGYIWLLSSVKNESSESVFIILETFKGGEDSKMATYVFDIPKDSYQGIRTLREINNALIMINFRREPVYLTEEQLSRSADKGYRFAAKNIRGLSMLREFFSCRIIYKDTDSWKEYLYKAVNTTKEK